MLAVLGIRMTVLLRFPVVLGGILRMVGLKSDRKFFGVSIRGE